MQTIATVKSARSFMATMTVLLLMGCGSTPPTDGQPTNPPPGVIGAPSDGVPSTEGQEIDFTYEDHDTGVNINAVYDSPVNHAKHLKILHSDNEQIPEEVVQSGGLNAQSLRMMAAASEHFHPVSFDGSKLILKRVPGMSGEFGYEVGDALTSQASSVFPRGALLKVVKKEKVSNDEYVLTTEPEVLENVIDEADVESRTDNLDKDALVKETPHVAGLKTTFLDTTGLSAQAVNNLQNIQVSIPDGTIIGCSSDPSKDNIQVSGGINLNLALNTDVVVDWPYWYSIEPDVKVEGAILVDETANIKLTANCVNKNWSVPLTTFEFGELSFSIGVVSLRARPKVTISLNGDGSITGSVEFKQSYNGKYGGGADNYIRNGFYSIADSNLKYGITNVPFQGSARVYPQLKGDLNLYVNPPVVGEAGAVISSTVNLGGKPGGPTNLMRKRPR